MSDDKRVVRASKQCCHDTLVRFQDCLEEMRAVGIKIGTTQSIEHDIEFTVEIADGVYFRNESLEQAVRDAVYVLGEAVQRGEP